jgi:hypothetical protein
MAICIKRDAVQGGLHPEANKSLDLAAGNVERLIALETI